MADPRDAENARLRSENAELRSENAELRAQVAELKKTVEELRALLARDSTNSSLPPSKDDQEGRKKRRAKAREQREAPEGKGLPQKESRSEARARCAGAGNFVRGPLADFVWVLR